MNMFDIITLHSLLFTFVCSICFLFFLLFFAFFFFLPRDHHFSRVVSARFYIKQINFWFSDLACLNNETIFYFHFILFSVKIK